MKKVRAANKAKLKSLEWTDEAIEQLTYANPQVTKASTEILSDADKVRGGPILDTMEAKIARAQQRKFEAEQREIKKSKLPQKLLSHQTTLSTLKGDVDVSLKLNRYFALFLEENPHFINPFNIMFPLDLYDSSVFDEFLQFSKVKFPVTGACLLSESGPELSPR
eukprot:gene56759-77793_t